MDFLTKRAAIKHAVDAALTGMISAIEDDRYEPSERGAGDAPTENAVENAEDLLCDLITELGKDFGVVDMDKVNGSLTLAEIKTLMTMDNIHDFEELEEIDTFVRDAGERKYRYDNTVFKHIPTGRFICVEIQKSADGEQWGALTSFEEVEKKEKISYEWG